MAKSQLSVSSIHVSFIVHASERENSVVETVKNTLLIANESFERIPLEGYYGNPIIRYIAHLTGNDAAPFVSNLFSKLTEGDKQILKIDLEKYIDEHQALHLRLDKQALFEGKIQLSQRDSVKIRIKPKIRYAARGLVQAYSEALLGE